MKLTDLTAAVVENNPNLTLEIETEGKGTEDAVFRNVLLISEEERQEMFDSQKGLEKVMTAKTGGSIPHRAAAISKQLLTLVVENKEHIKVIDAYLAKSPSTYDAHWIQLFELYQEKTHLGEASSSQEL